MVVCAFITGAVTGFGQAGKGVYDQHCAACHGANGDGNGPAAVWLYPKPRNFSAGLFKIKSTPAQSLPTDEDLFQSITRGLAGSSMPSFLYLTEQERRDVVQFVKSLTARTDASGKRVNLFEAVAANGTLAKPVEVPPETPNTVQELTLGRDMYQKMQSQRLNLLAVRKTRGKSDEGAELYVNEAGQRTGILALRPERFAQDAALRDYLRHEFTHLHDMVDPAFGYSPMLELPALNAAQQRLARERYRLLWDITIDGRLTAAGHAPMAARDQHAAAFSGGYSFWPADRQTETFDSLWRNAAPRHADFLALIADSRGLREAHRPAPGASCPLCDFPTFTWADVEALPPRIKSRIVAEFPSWSPEQGLCGRCLETYEAATSLEMTKP